MPNDSMRTVLVALGSGLAVALAKLVAAVVTGSSAMAAEADRDRDADGSSQPLGPADEERVRAFLASYPGVTAIREVQVTFTGPGRVRVIARLDIAGDLRGAEVTSLVRGIESGMKCESEAVYRVDVVPIGRGS